ncbi:hypothetical protein V8E51_014922 [Hyaloscypha variabilis]
MSHSVPRDMGGSCQRGDRVAASMLDRPPRREVAQAQQHKHRPERAVQQLSTGSGMALAWLAGSRLRFSQLSGPRSIGCAGCTRNPAPIAERPCGKSVAEAMMLDASLCSLCSLHVSEASRRAASCLALAGLLDLLSHSLAVSPAPRPKPPSLQVWARRPQEFQESNITTPTPCPSGLCPMPAPSIAQGPHTPAQQPWRTL